MMGRRHETPLDISVTRINVGYNQSPMNVFLPTTPIIAPAELLMVGRTCPKNNNTALGVELNWQVMYGFSLCMFNFWSGWLVATGELSWDETEWEEM